MVSPADSAENWASTPSVMKPEILLQPVDGTQFYQL
jgi:hypothetical protein